MNNLLNNPMVKKCGAIAVVAILIIVLLFSCSGSAKSTAIDFAEAKLSDLNAKKMVSLMSEDYKEDLMKNNNAATEKVLISRLEKGLESYQEKIENKYGSKWKVEIKHIDNYEVDDNLVEVVLSVTYKGKGGFLGLSDEKDTEEVTVALCKENGKWKVCEWGVTD